MRTLNITIGLALALSLAILFGCSKSGVAKPPFVHRNAGGMLLLQGAGRIHYEFVGTTFRPVSGDGNYWDHADVYVLVITDEKGKTESNVETIPVVYRGGRMTVVDKPDLQIVLKQADS